jgi:nucleotide-binding universal stress UspA family protein
MQHLIRHILVPTDFSSQSATALQVAAEFARQSSAQISLLHVVDSLLYREMWAAETVAWNTKNSAINKIINELKYQLINFAGKNAPNLVITPCVAFQNIYTAINQYAKNYENCLIIMGSKGTGDSSFLIGSNTENIIRTSTVPVLVVKNNDSKSFNLKKICLAGDFAPNSVPFFVMTFIKSLQQIFEAELQLLKVITPQHFELTTHTQQSLKDFATQNGLTNVSLNFYNHYTEYEGILAFAEQNQTGLVCMTTHGSTGFMQVILGSIAEDVANHAKIPVLTFRV